MTKHTVIEPALDDIRCFLPQIDDAEYSLRKRLRSARNVATFALTTSSAGVRRNLMILLRDHANDWIYQPAPMEHLALAVELAQRLYNSATMAEKLEAIP